MNRATFIKYIATAFATPSLLPKNALDAVAESDTKDKIKETVSAQALRVGDVVRFDTGQVAMCTAILFEHPSFKTLNGQHIIPYKHYTILCGAFIEK